MTTVAVVGAGIAGLGAAYALQDAGLQVLVLEQSDSVGGRMLTHTEQGFTWEPGAQFMLDGQYSAMKRLMATLGVSMSPHPIPALLANALPDGRIDYFQLGNPKALLRHPAIGMSAKWKAAKVLMAAWRHRHLLSMQHPERMAPVDTESLRTWGDREIGRDAVDWLLSVPWSTLFFWRPEDTPWFYSIYGALGWKAVVPSGGMGAVPAALARRLDVRLRTRVQRVDVLPDGKACLRTVGPAGQADVVVDRVVIAAPAPITLAMLPNADSVLGKVRVDFIRATRYVRNLTTAVAYRRPPEARAYGFGVPLATGSPVAGIDWTHQKGPDRAPVGTGLGVVMPTDAWSVNQWQRNDNEVASELVAATDAFYPGSRADVLFHRVHRWEYAMPVMEPGRTRALAEAIAAGPVSGSPVFTCGDYWTGPNTEMALVSGWRTAAEVLRSVNTSVPQPWVV